MPRPCFLPPLPGARLGCALPRDQHDAVGFGPLHPLAERLMVCPDSPGPSPAGRRTRVPGSVRVYQNVRDRTGSYENVRHRTTSYGIVRVRTRSYGNVQNAFRGKLVPVMHLELSRGILGPSGANFGIVFPILVRWALFSPKQRIGKTAVSTQHSAFSLPPKKQRQSARRQLLSLADRFCIVNQRVGCCSFAAHGS